MKSHMAQNVTFGENNTFSVYGAVVCHWFPFCDCVCFFGGHPLRFVPAVSVHFLSNSCFRKIEMWHNKYNRDLRSIGCFYGQWFALWLFLNLILMLTGITLT